MEFWAIARKRIHIQWTISFIVALSICMIIMLMIRELEDQLLGASPSGMSREQRPLSLLFISNINLILNEFAPRFCLLVLLTGKNSMETGRIKPC